MPATLSARAPHTRVHSSRQGGIRKGERVARLGRGTTDYLLKHAALRVTGRTKADASSPGFPKL